VLEERAYLSHADRIVGKHCIRGDELIIADHAALILYEGDHIAKYLMGLDFVPRVYGLNQSVIQSMQCLHVGVTQSVLPDPLHSHYH
jgi:hypothetical protein